LGCASLQISPGLNGRMEASTNLADWMTPTNFVGTNSIIHFRDAATNLNQVLSGSDTVIKVKITIRVKTGFVDTRVNGL
jgi:hypothetical protein